jgi:multiple sugar transport system substrate-binding protein
MESAMRFPLASLFLPLIALALPLSGCALSHAGGEGAASGKVQVRVWSMWGGDEAKVFQNVLDVYNRTHPGVEITNLSSVTDVKTVRALVAGAPPDFFTIADPAYLGTLAANDAVLPLDDQFQAAGLKQEDFTAGSLSQCRYRGKLYAMPYLVDCIALLYNKKVFREVGLDQENPPQTNEELEEY